MRDASTDLGGGVQTFPATAWTVVLEAGAPDDPASRAALGRLVAAYWKPVYCYIRRRWRKSNEDAKDLTQEFFATLLDRGLVARCRAEQVRFRAFVRASVEHFLLEAARRARRLRRGGAARHVVLDPATEADLVAGGEDPEREFDRLWAAGTVRQAVAALGEMYRASGRIDYFEVFRRTQMPDGATPTYAEVARGLGITVDDVQNRLRHARASLRALIRRIVNDSLLAGEDLDNEMNTLFGNGGRG